MTFASIYKKGVTSSSKLIIGDPEGSTAIVTLWTKASELAKKLNPATYCVIGQLFSAERGLDLLVRNLLANPQITNLIVTGVDFSHSGVVLMDFFEKGFYKGKTDTTEKPVWRVNSQFEGYIDLDIPEEALTELRQSVKAQHVPDITTFDFTSLQKPPKTRQKRVLMKKEEKLKHYVGDYIGYVIRGKTVAEVWLKLLDTILKFGKESDTHYDDRQREIMNLITVISDEDPYNLFIPDYLPGDRDHVMQYIPRITRDISGGTHENAYTYGSRMRSWFGTDQIKRAIQKLVRERISRAVVISLWDPTKDLEIGGSPCLNHIWLRVVEGKLYMTCIFRSHDMFEGYPENAFGLRILQEEIRKELIAELEKKGIKEDIQLGSLITLSQSAHVYDDSWDWCKRVVKKYLPQYTNHMAATDPRGNFIISVRDKKIILEHTSPNNEHIGEYSGTTAFEVMRKLATDNVVSLVSHGMDLGMELMKAELAIKYGTDYVQDQSLPPLTEEITVEKSVESKKTITYSIRTPIKPGIAQGDDERKMYGSILRKIRLDSYSNHL